MDIDVDMDMDKDIHWPNANLKEHKSGVTANKGIA